MINADNGPSTGDVDAQVLSWAGDYDDGDDPPEWEEDLFCTAYGGDANPAYCLFADQTHFYNYFDTQTSWGDFPFDFYQSRTVYWDKDLSSPYAPGAISPASGASVSGTQVAFSWGAVVASQYNLRVATDSSFSNVVIDYYFSAPSSPPPSDPPQQIELAFSGFPDNGVTYWWKVSAAHPLGWSNWSETRHFINGPSAGPAVPSLSSPGNGATQAGTQVSFQWNPAARAIKYRFQLALNDGFAAGDMVVDTEVSYPYIGSTISGLPDNGWNFSWRVGANNSSGWSGWSETRHFVNGPSGGPAVPGLSSPGNGATQAGTQVSFQWNPAARAIKYRFQLALNDGFAAGDMMIDTEVPYPYIGSTISGLPDNGWNFSWRVSANNSSGWSNWSETRHFVNGPSGGPAVPGLSSPGNGATQAGTQVSFQWNPAARAIKYRFQLALNDGFAAGDMMIDTEVPYPYIGSTISGLPDNGWNFSWRVSANNSSGWSNWSETRHFVNGPSGGPAVPGLSSPGNGATQAGTQVSFQWNPAARAIKYRFQLALNDGFAAGDMMIDTEVPYPYIGSTISGLPDNGWNFSWRVSANNSSGWSNWSETRHFVNGPSGGPAVPSLSSPGNGATQAGTQVAFLWNSAARAIKYQFQLARNDGFAAGDILVDTEVPYPYIGSTISGMPDNGLDFYWRVRANNSMGWSGWSETRHFVNGPSAAPNVPTLLQPEDGMNMPGTLIQFRWAGGARASSFRLQLAHDSSFTQIVFDEEIGYYSGITLSAFSDHGISYWWRMMSFNSLGSSAWSEAWSFVNGPGQRGDVSGLITDGSNPLGRAVVSVDDKAAMTGMDGRYVVHNVPPGPHTVAVACQGFHSTGQEIVMPAGGSLELDYALVSDGTLPDLSASPTALTFVGTAAVAQGTGADVTASATGPSEVATDDPPDVVPNQYIIAFLPDALPETSQRVAEEARLDRRALYNTRLIKSRLSGYRVSSQDAPAKALDVPLAYVVVEVKGDSERFLADFGQMRGVQFVEPRHYARAFDSPSDPMYALQHALPRVQLTGAWDRCSVASPPLVAIVDTGIDYAHPDLVAQFGPLKGYDFVDSDADPAPDASWETHGTHVAGIIAATRDNGIGVAGAAPAVLLSLRALDQEGRGTQDDVADAINWAATHGARIVNLSLGGSADLILEAAVENAWNHNVLLVAASGNESRNAISYPAAYDEVIAVGAISQANGLADFSNYGPQQELVAPGTTILSTYPQADYAVASGTSMASPLVAGVAALTLSCDPSLGNSQLRALLTGSADDLGSPGWDPTYGYGRVNAWALLDRLFGPPNSQRLVVRNTGQALLEVRDVTHSSSWLSATPRAFTVWPGTEQNIYVMVDPAGLSTGVYTDQISIQSNALDEPALPVVITLSVTSTITALVDPNAGGMLMSPTGDLTVEVPPGCVDETSYIYFQSLVNPLLEGPMQPAKTWSLEVETALGTPVTTFGQPLTISVAYTDDEMAGLVEASLALRYLDTSTSDWIPVDTTVDPETNVAHAQVDHLTTFALMGASPPAAPSAVAIDRTRTDIVLNWAAVTTNEVGRPTAVDHYNIYGGTAPYFAADSSALLATVGVTTFAHPVTPENARQPYYYLITAVDANGMSRLSRTDWKGSAGSRPWHEPGLSAGAPHLSQHPASPDWAAHRCVQ